jgi:hypothetical protein
MSMFGEDFAEAEHAYRREGIMADYQRKPRHRGRGWHIPWRPSLRALRARPGAIPRSTDAPASRC